MARTSSRLARWAQGILFAQLTLSPILFWTGLIDPFESPKVLLLQLSALALLVVGLAELGFSGGQRGDWQIRYREHLGNPVSLAVLFGVGSAMLSTVCSISPRTSLLGAADSHAGLGSVLALAVLFFGVRAVARDLGTVRVFLGACILGCLLAAGYGLVQALALDPIPWHHPAEFAGYVRPFGSLGHANHLGGLAMIVFPVLLWFWKPGKRLAVVLTGTVLAGIALLALSRAAWLGAGLATLFLLVAWPRQQPRMSWQLAGGLILALVLGGGLLLLVAPERVTASLAQRLTHLSSVPSRLVLWRDSLVIFQHYPVTGSGLDTFTQAYTPIKRADYWRLEWGLLPSRAHQEFLHVLATQGMVGGLAYLGLLGALVLAWVRAWRLQPTQRVLTTCLGAALLAGWAQNQFGFALSTVSGCLICLAALLSRLGEPGSISEEVESPAANRFLLGLACGGWLVYAVNFVFDVSQPSLSHVALVLIWIALTGVPGMMLIWARKSSGPVHVISPPGWIPRLILGSLCATLPAWFALVPVLSGVLCVHGDRCIEADPACGATWHETAVELCSWHPEIHTRLATALQVLATTEPDPRRKRAYLTRAHQAIEEACRLEPRVAEYHANRGRILCDRIAADGGVEPGKALAAFDVALGLHPTDSATLADAGRACLSFGLLDKAHDYLNKGLAMDPDNPVLRTERAVLHFRRGELRAGIDVLWSCQLLDWHGEVTRREQSRWMLAGALLEARRPWQSLGTVIDPSLKEFPESRRGHWLRARALQMVGKHAESRLEDEKAQACQR